MSVGYMSCAHLTNANVDRTIHIRDNELQNSSHLRHCVKHNGELQGHISSQDFTDHCFLSEHYICLRCQPPLDLCCVMCQDFQFCSHFDQYIDRDREIGKRSHSLMEVQAPLSTNSFNPARFVKNRSMKGYCNMGSTCSMSAVLQMFTRNAVLVYCKEMQPSAGGSSTWDPSSCNSPFTSRHSLQTDESQGSSISCVNCIYSIAPMLLSLPLHSIWSEMESIAGYPQQDAHEFILALLEGLERHLKVNHHIELPIPLSRASSLANSPLMTISQKAVDPAASSSTDALRRGLRTASFDRSNNCGFLNKRIAPRDRSSTFEANDDLLIEGLIAERPPDVVENLHDVFSGLLQSQLTCNVCGHLSIKRELFTDLSLSIESPLSKSALPRSTRKLTTDRVSALRVDTILSGCLETFTAVKSLGQKMFYKACGQDQLMSKQLTVYSPPNVLIIHLKRFDYLAERKITTRISAELTLCEEKVHEERQRMKMSVNGCDLMLGSVR